MDPAIQKYNERQNPAMNRNHRQQLASIIRRYLDGEISAFEFDDLAGPYRSSDDTTVRYVAGTAWFVYDDLNNHHVNLTKPEWDCFQRLLLLLDSRGHIVVTTTKRWSLSQVAAPFALLVFGLAVFQLGFGIRLLLITVPLGLVSICIARFRDQRQPASACTEVLMPFSTFTELRRSYDAVPRFRKKRYPGNLSARRVRSAAKEFLMLIPSYCIRVVLSPVALFFQMFPATRRQTRVIAA